MWVPWTMDDPPPGPCRRPSTGGAGSARRPRRPARKPGWLRVRAPGSAWLPAPQAAGPGTGAAHRLRGGELPQHRRVLAPRHRHLHDPGRRLHPRVRLLQRRARPARPRRRGRAGPRGGSGADPRPRSRGRHVRRPRRSRGRGRRGLRRHHHRDPRAVAGLPHRDPRAGLRRARRLARHRARGGAGRSEPQSRDRPRPVSAGAPRRRLRPRPPPPRARPPAPSPGGDEVGDHGGPRRDPGRARRGPRRPAAGGMRHRDDRPVPAAVARPPAGRALLPPRRSSRRSGKRRWPSASATSSPDPLVRSSYHAHEQADAIAAATAPTPTGPQVVA